MANNSADLYAQMGIAALLPGMTRALELLQAEVDSMRAMLANAQAGNPIVNGPGTYWDALTPEERSREMKRRQKVAAGKAKSVRAGNGKGAAAKERWSKLSKKAKAARVATMNTARLAKMKTAAAAIQ